MIQCFGVNNAVMIRMGKDTIFYKKTNIHKLSIDENTTIRCIYYKSEF
jgi:hypothetical protein